MFLKPQVRRSMLSKMLTEILDTRVMVKKSMKLVDETDRALLKLLNARQLGLKFIANVTYGYTSATFSGRMPCVEIADAIVQTGRETLERVSPAFGLVGTCATDSQHIRTGEEHYTESTRLGSHCAVWRYRLPVCPSSRQNKRRGLHDRERDSRHNHSYESKTNQAEIRKGSWPQTQFS